MTRRVIEVFLDLWKFSLFIGVFIILNQTFKFVREVQTEVYYGNCLSKL